MDGFRVLRSKENHGQFVICSPYISFEWNYGSPCLPSLLACPTDNTYGCSKIFLSFPFICVDYDIFNLTKRCGGSKTGLYIYILLCFYVSGPCLCNMWIGLETSRTESLVVFNLCYQLSFADFFVQKEFRNKINSTSVESGVFGMGKSSTER